MRFYILFTILLLFGIGIYSICHIIKKRNTINAAISKLPSFSCLTSDSSIYAFPEVSTTNKKYTLICYISVECDHCIQMIDELEARKTRLEKSNILLITKASLAELKKFAEAHFLNNWKGVILLSDQRRQLLELLHVDRFPTVYLYNNQNGNLMARFQGGFSLKLLFEKIR